MTLFTESQTARGNEDNTASLQDDWRSLVLSSALAGVLLIPYSISGLIDKPKWQPIKNIETTRAQIPGYISHAEETYLDEIESPLMPPRKKHKVEISIKNIRRGLPSIGDSLLS